MAIRLNGTDVPAKVLGNKWDELVGKLVLIDQYAEGIIEVPYENGMGRLLSISPQGICKFIRRDESKFSVHIDDIKEMRPFLSKNYRA